MTLSMVSPSQGSIRFVTCEYLCGIQVKLRLPSMLSGDSASRLTLIRTDLRSRKRLSRNRSLPIFWMTFKIRMDLQLSQCLEIKRALSRIWLSKPRLSRQMARRRKRLPKKIMWKARVRLKGQRERIKMNWIWVQIPQMSIELLKKKQTMLGEELRKRGS